MKDNYTHITLVVDRSGSMQSIAADAQGGINKFVDEQKKVPGDATFYLTDFDDVHRDMFGPDSIQSFGTYALEPRGSTALHDAIGKAIVKTGGYLADMAEDDRPGKVVFGIVTDGGENASKDYKLDKIREMVNEHRDTYKWEFVFIGANIDAYAVGNTMGMHNTSQYQPTARSVSTSYAAFSDTVSAYRGAEAGTPMQAMASVDADGNLIDPKDAPNVAKTPPTTTVKSST